MSAKSVTRTITITTVYEGPGGGAFFYGHDSAGKGIRVRADYDRIARTPIRGETWQVMGQFKFHEKFRYQLHAEHCRLVEPTGALLARYLCAHPAFRGIGVGAGKIAKLNKIFGDGLREVLESGDVDALTRDKVLTQVTAEKLVATWRANAQETSVIAFLDKHSLDVRLAGKILRYWGEKAVEKLTENPYRLLILTNWSNVDRVAHSLGVAQDDPRRLIAATESYTYSRLDSRKDTLTGDADLKRGVRRLIGHADHTTVQRAIDLSVQERAVVGDTSFGYQPLGCAVMEKALVDRFNIMLPSAAGVQIDLFGTSGGNSLVDHRIYCFEQEESIRLNHEQRRAVHMAATTSLSVMKGGAGVGKTTVLKAIHQVVKAMSGTVFQMALAGRAAQRMREATGEDAYTIVGFLNRIKHQKLMPKPSDLVIIDESSMLDLLLVYRLLRALPHGIRLLFVGDHHQLPPIGPGLIFHVLATSSKVPSTELVEVHRQALSTGIPQVANQVRHGVMPNLSDYQGTGTGVSFIECPQHSIIDRLTGIMSDLGGFEETQILGVIKAGAAGVNKINDTFHHIMTPSKPSLYRWDLAESDSIIYTVNDYDRELFNGSLGYVEKVFPDGLELGDGVPIRLRANFDGRQIDLTEEDLGDVDLAYAITVHKAQGSQFRRVIIPVTKSKILDRTLIYTALTRGIEQVVFVGDKRALSQAVVNPPFASLRQVGFSI